MEKRKSSQSSDFLNPKNPEEFLRTRKESSAGAIIYYINKEPKFLLVKSTYWGFVKGIIESGENIKDTIIREAKEEANITELEFIPKTKFTQTWMYKREGKLISKDAVFLIARINSAQSKKTRISKEHQDFGWFSIEEALKKIKIKNNKEMLKAAYKIIREQEQQTKLI